LGNNHRDKPAGTFDSGKIQTLVLEGKSKVIKIEASIDASINTSKVKN